MNLRNGDLMVYPVLSLYQTGANTYPAPASSGALAINISATRLNEPLGREELTSIDRGTAFHSFGEGRDDRRLFVEERR